MKGFAFGSWTSELVEMEIAHQQAEKRSRIQNEAERLGALAAKIGLTGA